MKRIFGEFAYGDGPRAGCWWDETIAAPNWPRLADTQTADVAIIGGGFTGISAALHLAQAGVDVAVLEANTPGWGASGRNGGFCCLGGSKLSHGAMTRTFGEQATAEYEAGESAAVDLVQSLLSSHAIEADTHSRGETQLAHTPRAMRHLRQEAESMEREGIDPQLVEQADLRRNGLHGSFFGALTRPEGFALNPRRYLFGLADAATRHGARLFQNSAVTALDRRDRGFVLRTAQGEIRANQVIIATNGYSSEDLPPWLAGRYMPAQSTVMVTRPMSEAELEAQGWTTAQMAYDTRNMLHYFRLMPDRRFLFGMRGGLLASPGVEQRIRLKLRRDFDAMFPDWAQVETTHMWSGMVCLSRNLVPFVGPVPEQPGLFAGLCYHGNGVAMGTYSGRLLAGLILDQPGELPYSPVMQKMRKFPLGPMRRALMPPAYAVLAALDL